MTEQPLDDTAIETPVQTDETDETEESEETVEETEESEETEGDGCGPRGRRRRLPPQPA